MAGLSEGEITENDLIEDSGEIVVVGALKTVRKNLPLFGALQPDVVVFDPFSPARSAKASVPFLRAALPGSGLVVLTAHSEGVYRRAALTAGADEFVAKAEIVPNLLGAIRRAASQTRASAVTEEKKPYAR